MTKPTLLSRRLFAFLFPVAAGAQTRRAPVSRTRDRNDNILLPDFPGPLAPGGETRVPAYPSNTLENRAAIKEIEEILLRENCPHEWIASSTFSVRANLLGNQANLFVPVEHCARCGVLRLPNAYWGQR